MALKNIKKQQIQFTQYVSDPDQSIRDLIRPEKKYEKNPNPKKQPATLPPSFYQQKRPRGSSAGHSPQVPSPSHVAHGGSVDEVASSSRTAISPAMGMMPNQPNIHKRQVSAPELHPDYNLERISIVPPSQPPQNVNHQHSKSVSAIPPMSMGFPEPQHVKSVSHEAYSYSGFSEQPSHQGMMQQNREKSSSLDPMRRPFMTPQDVEQLPMPHGWEVCYDSEGHRYYKDHNSKTTTWNDPRLIPRDQSSFGVEDMGQGYNNFYDQGHPSRSLPTIHQPHPQMMPNHPQPQYSSQQQMDYIQQLQNERMMIQEKNAQLMNSGLLDSPQPQQFQAISPMGSNMMHQHDQNYMFQQQAQTSQQQQQPQHGINQMTNQYQNSQMNDNAMEVEYSIPTHPQQQHQHQQSQSSQQQQQQQQQQHQPQMHRDMQNNYAIDDINPHEFDQYLQISNDTNRSMVHHYQ